MKVRQGQLPGKPPCPNCGRILDGFTCMNGTRAPEAGDLTICGYCATPLSFDGKGFERLTGSALVLARLDEAFLRAETVARMSRKAFRK